MKPKWQRLCRRVSTRQKEINTLVSYDNLKKVDRENCAGRVMEGIRKEEQTENKMMKEKYWFRWMGYRIQGKNFNRNLAI